MNALDAAYQVLRQGSKAIVIFQTGLTGCNLSSDPVRPVILSRIKKPQIHSPPEELSMKNCFNLASWPISRCME